MLLSFMVLALNIDAQVVFKVSDGLEQGSLKTAIEKNATALINEINNAQAAGRALDFRSLSLTTSAQQSLSMLWENVPFRFTKPRYAEIVARTASGGYQVRHLSLELKPYGVKVTDDKYQEAVIDFNSRGQIESFYFAISSALYSQVMLGGKDVEDLRRRQAILDYVEHFRTAYNQKDINFLNQVFSDDAIVITGKVITTKPTDLNPVARTKITYKSQTKTQYLTNLKRCFDRSPYIKVSFTDVKVSRHPTRPEFYGVLVRQGYNSGYYKDDGYVFLMWDFRDEDRPQIHVRTWQPYYMDASQTKVIPKSEIFDIRSFDF